MSSDQQIPAFTAILAEGSLSSEFSSSFVFSPVSEKFNCMIPAYFHESGKKAVLFLLNDTADALNLKVEKGIFLGTVTYGEKSNSLSSGMV